MRHDPMAPNPFSHWPFTQQGTQVDAGQNGRVCSDHPTSACAADLIPRDRPAESHPR